MLHVTITFMNKKLLITLIMCAGLLMIAIGCNTKSQQGGCLGVDCDSNNAAQSICPLNAQCSELPDGVTSIRFNEPTKLITVLDSLQPSQKIFKMEVLETSGMVNVVALNGAYSDAETLLQEYQSARESTSQALINNLESWQSRDSDVGLSNHIDAVKEDISKQPDINLLVVQVTVMED